MLIAKLIAAGGLLFAFQHATIAGKVVLFFLAVGSIFSWSVMITKLRVIQFARKQNARFLTAFRQDRQPHAVGPDFRSAPDSRFGSDRSR